MLCLDDTDTLEGGASVDAVVDYTVHGLIGSTFTVLADGQLSDTDPSVLYTAGAAISVVCVTFVNTHSSAVTVNLYLDSADGGNPRRMIPKDVSLGIGYSLHFDGQRISIMDTTGGIAYTYIAHTHDGDTLQLDGINSDGGAFAFTTSGKVTFSQNIDFAGQLGFPAGQSASADANTLDDYEEGTWTGALVPGTSGSITMNGSYVTGAYTKIGRVVSITGYFVVSSVSSPVGVLSLTGLPFACADGDEFDVGLGLYLDTLNATAATTMLGRIVKTASAVTIWHFAAGAANPAAADIKAGSLIKVSGTYFTT